MSSWWCPAQGSLRVTYPHFAPQLRAGRSATSCSCRRRRASRLPSTRSRTRRSGTTRASSSSAPRTVRLALPPVYGPRARTRSVSLYRGSGVRARTSAWMQPAAAGARPCADACVDPSAPAHRSPHPTLTCASRALPAGIIVEAYAPIGNGHAIGDTVLPPMAAKYGASVAQLLLQYELQSGADVVLPRSKTQSHMKARGGAVTALAAFGPLRRTAANTPRPPPARPASRRTATCPRSSRACPSAPRTCRRWTSARCPRSTTRSASPGAEDEARLYAVHAREV